MQLRETVEAILGKSYTATRAAQSLKLVLRGYGREAPETFRITNIELTNRCPFKCVMCVRTAGMTRAQGDMDPELFKRIIDEYFQESPDAARTSELSFTHFGESLLHEQFEELIAYAVSKGCSRTLLSINPLMLTDDTADRLLRCGLSRIHISLDGHDDATFEHIRGVRKAYSKSVERLEKFLHKAERLRPNRPLIRLGMINFPENAASIERLKAVWESHPGIDEFWSKQFTVWSGQVESVNRLVDYKPSDRYVITCSFPWLSMTVLWDGRVVPCCSDHDGIYVYGDLKQSTLSQIWRAEPISRLREEFLSGTVTNKLCANCDYLGKRFD